MANDASAAVSEPRSVPSEPNPTRSAKGQPVTAQPAQSPAKQVKRRRVPRWEVVQTLLGRFEDPRYLEVGVSKGTTFHQISAASKVAVDPVFKFDWETERRRRSADTEYYQVTSDVYFGAIVDDDQQFDVIFLDGLHTFEQTLRDFTNALTHLAPRGVIVIDDVNPPTYHASLPDPSRYQRLRKHVKDDRRAWMGDVYKLVWFIDTFYQSMSYATVADNHGQAVVWRERRTSVVDRSTTEIGDLSFESFVLGADVLQRRPFAEIVADMGPHIGTVAS